MTVSKRKFCLEPKGTVEANGGPSIRWITSSFDGSTQPYAIYIPKDYSPEKKWPLVISLHGHSSDHILNLRRVMGCGNLPGEHDQQAKTYFPELPNIDYIVASPYGFGSLRYEGPAETDVLDVLADVCDGLSIDHDRIYLTGLSMGGYGTWMLGMKYPGLFAAIAPVCAPIDSTRFKFDVETLPIFAYDQLTASSTIVLAPNLRHTPVWVTHGTDDEVVSVQDSREMVLQLKDLGIAVDYDEYPGVKHNAWDVTYADGAVFEWFSHYRKVKSPRVVDFTTPALRWSSAYWVRILQMEERPTPATIYAEVIAPNQIVVGTSNVEAFAISVADAPVDPKAEIKIIWNGQPAFQGIPDGPEIGFGPVRSGKTKKRAHLEGPVADAFNDRHVVIYGTRGGNEPLLEAAKDGAETLVDYGRWGDINIPVKPDSKVTEADIHNNNLILVGNQETNSMIALVNESTPVKFDSDGVRSGRRRFTGSDLGLILVYPSPLNPDKYVVVLGGNSPKTTRMAVEACRCAPDYVVFDSFTDFTDPGSILDWGYFNNIWGFGKRT